MKSFPIHLILFLKISDGFRVFRMSVQIEAKPVVAMRRSSCSFERSLQEQESLGRTGPGPLWGAVGMGQPVAFLGWGQGLTGD